MPPYWLDSSLSVTLLFVGRKPPIVFVKHEVPLTKRDVSLSPSRPFGHWADLIALSWVSCSWTRICKRLLNGPFLSEHWLCKVVSQSVSQRRVHCRQRGTLVREGWEGGSHSTLSHLGRVYRIISRIKNLFCHTWVYPASIFSSIVRFRG